VTTVPFGIPRRRGGDRAPISLLAPAAVAAIIALLPLWYLADRALDEGPGSVWQEVVSAQTAALLARSLGLVAVVTGLCLVIGIACALLVVRTDVPGAGLMEVLLAVPLAVPSFVAAFAWVSWRPSIGGFWGATLVLTLVSYPFVYLPVSAALRRLDPAQEEVSRSLGRGAVRTVFSVTLPQVRTAAAAGGLLVALYTLSDFGAVGTMRYEAFTWVIYGAFRAGFDPSRAAVLACVLVVVALGLVWAEAVVRGRPNHARIGAGTPRPQTPVELGRWRWLAMLPVLGVLSAAVVFPAASVVVWFNRGLSAGIDWSGLGEALASTILVAGLGALATMLMAVPLGILSARHHDTGSRLLERSVYVAHGLPGIVVALSLVFVGVTIARPLYQTTPMLAVAYAVLFLPLGVGSVRASVEQSPVALEEMAHSLGKGRAGVLFGVTLPLAAPGIAAGTALVLLAAMKELPATLLLHPTGMETLAMSVWSDTAVSRYASAAPAALALILLSTIPTWILTRSSRRIG
jgi:iron(III) transport system permease protein